MSTQFVVFTLGEELYAADIEEVLEIRLLEKITEVPGGAPYLRGMMNLRGKVIPVFDLAERIGVDIKGKSYKKIVIAEINEKLVGLLVNEVSGVERFDTIDEMPELIAQRGEKGYIKGVKREDDRLIMILKIGGIFSE
jgi:purine-binding chemotaxis protein CheW